MTLTSGGGGGAVAALLLLQAETIADAPMSNVTSGERTCDMPSP
jgi:hypothetical protein